MNEDPQSNTENNVGPRPDHQLGQEDRTLDSQTLSMQSEGDMSSPSFMSDDENGLHPGVVMKPPQQYRRNEASILEEDERADQSDQQQQQQGSIPGESLASFASLMIDDDRQLPPTIPRHVSPGAMSMAGPVVAPQSKPLIPGATAPAASEHMSDSISMDSQSSFASLIHTDDDDDAHHHHPHPHPSALVSSMSRSNAYASNPKTTSTTVRPGEMAAMGPATVLQSGKPPTDANMGDGDKLASSWTPPRRPIPPGIEAMPPLTQHSDPGASMTSSTTLGGDVSEASTFVTSTPTKQRRFTTPSAGTTTPNTTTRSRRISARQQTKFDPGDSPAGSISAPFSPLRTPPRSDSTKTRRWTTPDSFQQRQQQQSFTSSGDDSVLSSNIGSVAACGSHRSETHTAAAAAARSLIEEQEDFNAQEDDEDPELTNDELMLSDQPGAFAVDRSERGNTIRARVKDTDRHLSTLPLVQSQSSSHASSTNQLQLGLSANWIGGNSRQDVNGANTLATEDVESPHSGTTARYGRNTSIQYDTNMSASLPSQTQQGVLTAASTPILPSSLGRVDATNVNAVEDVDPKSSSSWKRYRWIVVASGLIFLAMAIAIPVILTAGKGAEHVRPNHQTTPTAAPVVAATASPTTAAPTSLERFQAFSDVIRANSTSNAVDLTTEGSPQYRAAKWLADQDPAQLDPSNTSLAQEIRDRYVAVVVYYSIGLNTKPHSQAYWWLTADSICKWNAVLDNTTYAQGISCMDNVTVTKLVVEQANVAGTIPTEIAHFSLLQTLDLSQNDLQGSIPTEIGDCLLLNFLDLCKFSTCWIYLIRK